MPTALIVEDEAMVLILAESVIQHAGYTTRTASSFELSRASCDHSKNNQAVTGASL